MHLLKIMNLMGDLNMLNQSITLLENYDKNAKKTLFEAEGIVEEKRKNNSEIANAEKRSRSRAIKTLNDLNK
jgi:hypothetical protein